MKAYNVYKRLGKTPLQSLEDLRTKLHIKKSTSLTYAGRLDPMAEGVLVILANVNDEQKNSYLKLPKSYEVEILFGFTSDSYDALGIPKKHRRNNVVKDDFLKIIKKYIGVISLPLPAFSSPPVQGKPLFEWARGKNIKNIQIPIREMEISSFHYKSQKIYTNKTLLRKIENNINKVRGDFRQGKIIKRWENILSTDPKEYRTFTCIVTCGSGTYIRSLCNDIGNNTGTGALALTLKRLGVGSFSIQKSLRI